MESNLNEKFINFKGDMREIALHAANKCTEFQKLAISEYDKGNGEKAQEYHVQYLAYLDIWQKFENVIEMRK